MNNPLSPLLTTVCLRRLEKFVNGPCDASAALLATADGRLVTVAQRIEMDAQRIAAIGGSMLALSEACARELGHSACRNTIVDTADGLTVFLRVNSPQGPWALTTVGMPGTSLGLLFTHSRQLAEQLGTLLSGSGESDTPALPTTLSPAPLPMRNYTQ